MGWRFEIEEPHAIVRVDLPGVGVNEVKHVLCIGCVGPAFSPRV